jgi:enoyl-CoA hydratase/carnithine racemase
MALASTEAPPPVAEARAGGVLTLTLDRPQQYNALSTEMIAALQAALGRAAADATVRVVVLAGAGKAFSAGHDLKEMRAHDDLEFQRALFERCSRLMLSIQELPQPVIARVHGIATAAGCQLVAACDLAVASEAARFGVSGINVGLFCSTPSVALARNVGRKQAMEMLLTGELIDAHTARERGLVNRVVPAAALDDEIAKLTAAIVAKTPVAVQRGKRTFYRQIEVGVAEAYQIASEAIACDMMTDDAKEGIDAFIQKRPPAWRGR